MKYRKLGKTGQKVSEIGLGGEYLERHNKKTVNEVVNLALDAGINIIDCFMSNPEVRSNIGSAIKRRRSQVYIQGHLRSIWKNNQYGRTLDINEVKFFFEDLLKRMQTDYIDIGMLHMIDNETDFNIIFNGPIYEYALNLKNKGTIRSIGISTHNTDMAIKAAENNYIDCILLSINPAYDLLSPKHMKLAPEPDTVLSSQYGIDEKRNSLYKLCQRKEIGITSMKTFGAGLLLSKERSPFKKELSIYQCISYVLSRPAVCSALIGMQSVDEVKEVVQYYEKTKQELDFSSVLELIPSFAKTGACVYCNHCLPCPMHLDIAQINKYLDLSDNGVSPSILEHYNSLEHKAGECIQCGTCEKQCPFGVKIIERMKTASKLFEIKREK